MLTEQTSHSFSMDRVACMDVKIALTSAPLDGYQLKAKVLLKENLIVLD